MRPAATRGSTMRVIRSRKRPRRDRRVAILPARARIDDRVDGSEAGRIKGKQAVEVLIRKLMPSIFLNERLSTKEMTCSSSLFSVIV